MPAAATTILLRFSGEIATKAKPTRARFEQRLVRNVRDALARAGIAAAVERHRHRIQVVTGDERALAVASRVFGVQSVALVEGHPAEKLDALAESAGVDLERPEATVAIELSEQRAYLCVAERRGPAGLPLGVEGSAVALLSGGFDSAVAAWQMLRRGVHLDYVFCNLGGRVHELGVVRVAQVLGDAWSYGVRPHLHAIDFAPVAAEIRAKTKTRYWQILLKRQFLRAAEAVAQVRHADAIVTGDAVGQVSSQTLSNIAVISQATALPILRPLVGATKDEIIRAAERIGTAPLSAVIDEYCAMVASRPATTSKLGAVEAEEAQLDPAVLARAIVERRVLDLATVDLSVYVDPALEVDAIPSNATVIDLRSRAAFAAWHWPGALHLDLDRALAAHPSFARDRRYVVYCEFGLKSAHLAERMRAAGLDAAHFRGGLRALVEHAKRSRVQPPELSE